MNLFVYGTLMNREVWGAVVKRSCRRSQGILEGYARLSVEGEVYPAALRRERSSIEGVICFDLDYDDFARLDRYEGDEYVRADAVCRSSDGAILPCQVYLFKEEFLNRVLELEWSYQKFVECDLREFLRKI